MLSAIRGTCFLIYKCSLKGVLSTYPLVQYLMMVIEEYCIHVHMHHWNCSQIILWDVYDSWIPPECTTPSPNLAIGYTVLSVIEYCSPQL